MVDAPKLRTSKLSHRVLHNVVLKQMDESELKNTGVGCWPLE